MSYNQTHTKQFVRAKPLQEGKEKPHSTSFTKDPKRNNKKYEEKSFQQNKDPRDHIKILLSEYKTQQKTPFVASLCEKFPKLFVDRPLKPEAQIQSTLTEFVMFGNKKQVPAKPIKQMSSDSSDPNWDSDQEKEVKLVSKKIDDSVIDKVNAAKKEAPKRMDDLQRHEKQFLEDYYRQKRHNMQQLKAQENKKQQEKKENAQVKESEPNKAGQSISEKKVQEEQDEWAEYDPNVGALITGGFIQKIQKGEEEDFDADEDFSYESQKSSSSSDDDDMFADEGPRAIVKTKGDSKTTEEKNQSGKEIVNITSYMFTQIAEQVGAIPQSCIWIISNKQARFKVSTQYMNEYYKSISLSFPFISLNHSEFIPYEELQTEKGVQKLKKLSQKRRNVNGFNKNRNQPRIQASHYKQKK